jgi:hypothetical protein
VIRIISLPRFQSSSSVSLARRYLFSNGAFAVVVVVVMEQFPFELFPAAVTIHRIGEIFDEVLENKVRRCKSKKLRRTIDGIRFGSNNVCVVNGL